MKSIMIDMDDVILNYGENFLHIINEYLKTDYKLSDIKNFYIQDLIPDKEDFFNMFFKTKNIYNYTKLLPSAYEVIEKLSKHYKIYIGTSYIYRENIKESGIILKYKYDFLMEKLPFLNHTNYVFLSDKSILNCNIKIDDRTDNLADCEKKLLFTAYHNKDISDQELKSQNIERVNNWKEVEKLLLTDLGLE